MSEASDLKREAASLQDDELQKRFSMLFDDGQGDNARREFVRYCRSRGYHPSEMSILCGNSLLQRLRNMVDKLNNMLSEDRVTIRFLFDKICSLNNDQLILPPIDGRKRAATFQTLIRRKFGTLITAKKIASQALKISSRQFSKLEAGTGLSDSLIERLEEYPDHVFGIAAPETVRASKTSNVDKEFEDFAKKLSFIPKPQKGDRGKSGMTPHDLRRSLSSWPLGEDWIPLFAKFTGYSVWNIEQFMKSGDDRKMTKDMERFIRQVNQALRDLGGVTIRVT